MADITNTKATNSGGSSGNSNSDLRPGLSSRRASRRNYRTPASQRRDSNSDRLVLSRSTDYANANANTNTNASVTSPRSLKTSTTIDNSNLDGGLYASPSSSSVHSSPRKASLMSEDEVSALVHNALLRARQATKSFSPRSARGSFASSPIKSPNNATAGSASAIHSPSTSVRSSRSTPFSVVSPTGSTNRSLYKSPVKSAISALEALSSPSPQSVASSVRTPVSASASVRSVSLRPGSVEGRPPHPVHSLSPASASASVAERPIISVPSLGEAGASASRSGDHNPTSPLSPGTARSMTSYRTARYLRSPQSTYTPGGGIGFDFHTPTRISGDGSTKGEEVRIDLGSRSHLELKASSSTTQSQSQSKLQSQSMKSTESTETTSDDIIRRVEEEIANARKAAHEATLRLAGVSADFWKKKQNRTPQQAPMSPNSKNKHIEATFSTDDEGHFDSALNVIGAEFDERSSDAGSETSTTVAKTSSSTTSPPVVVTTESSVDITEEKKESDPKDSNLVVCPSDRDSILRARSPAESMIGEDGATKDASVTEGIEMADTIAEDDDCTTKNNAAPTESTVEPSAEDEIPTARDDEITKSKSQASSGSTRGSRNRSIQECQLDYGPGDEIIADKLELELQEGASASPTVIDVIRSTGSGSAHELQAVLLDEKQKAPTQAESLDAVLSDEKPLPQAESLEAVLSDEKPLPQAESLEAVLSDEKPLPQAESLEAVLSDEKPLPQAESLEGVLTDEKILPKADTLEGVLSDEQEPTPTELSTATSSDKCQEIGANDESEDGKPANAEAGEVAEDPPAVVEDTAVSVEQPSIDNDDGLECSPEPSEEVASSPIRSNDSAPAEEPAAVEATPSVKNDGSSIGDKYESIGEKYASIGDASQSGTMSKAEEIFEDAIQEPQPEAETKDDTEDSLHSFVKSGSLEKDDEPQDKADTEKPDVTKEESVEDMNADSIDTEPDGTDRYRGHDHLYRQNSVLTADISIMHDQKTEIMDNRASVTNQLLTNLSVEREQERDENVPPNDLARVESVASTSNHRKTAAATEEPSSTFVPRTVGEPAETKKTVPTRGKKVRFKQRYPIPRRMAKHRDPSEITFDYQTEKPSDKLWLSKPKKDLKELLEATIGTSIQRRSNACGALKVLSTQEQNQLTLLRTHGFMDAVVFAITDNYSAVDAETGVAAKTRAVNVIKNVAKKKCNRHHILMHPGLGDGLVKTIVEDRKDARELACATLATLAKSQQCREPMSKIEKLIDVLAVIMKGDDPVSFDSERKTYADETKIDYSGDDEMSASPVVTESYSFESASTRSSYGVRSMDTLKEDPERRARTRMNACAALLHLSKECSISQTLCASSKLLFCLVACCKEIHNPIHTKCLEILANLTRFPHNNAILVCYPGLVDMLMINGSRDEDDADRLWAMRNFQNLSSDPSAKVKLAFPAVLELLSANMMRPIYAEQLASASAMLNIATEPGTVVSLTNTKNVVATLVHVAHSPTSLAEVRTIACDALATLGLWLQTLAGAGTVPHGVKSTPLPTYITSGWERWEK